MGSLAATLNRLGSRTVPRLTEKLGTDSLFVLRAASPTSDGRGGARKAYTPTTDEAIPCFYAVITSPRDEQLERIIAERKVPLVFRRFVCAAATDVTPRDRLTLVARGAVAEVVGMEIVRAAPISGVLMEIVTVEEQKPAVAP